jgi:hypothetical protein
MTLRIRPIETGDKPAWGPLWRDYLVHPEQRLQAVICSA